MSNEELANLIDLSLDEPPSPTSTTDGPPKNDAAAAGAVLDLKRAQADLGKAEGEYQKYQTLYADHKRKAKEIEKQKLDELHRNNNKDNEEVRRLRTLQIQEEGLKDRNRSKAKDAEACVRQLREYIQQLKAKTDP